ncbi:hypothetical protein [Aliterella atlantica]
MMLRHQLIFLSPYKPQFIGRDTVYYHKYSGAIALAGNQKAAMSR